MAQGHTTADFGAFPGTAAVDVAVTGQAAIVADSDVEAWIRAEVSADHSADEHEIEDFDVTAKSITAATGFTISMRPRVGRCYGVYNLSWAWST